MAFTILVSGASATGKTTCFRNLRDQENIIYLNTEVGKELTFPHSFDYYQVTAVDDVATLIASAEQFPEVHTIIVDSLTMLFDLWIQQRLRTVDMKNRQQMWGEFAPWVKNLFSGPIKNSTKNIILCSHTTHTVNDQKILEVSSIVPGQEMKKVTLESLFDIVISTKKVPLVDLKKFANPMLTISELEQFLGYKYVFQTRSTDEDVKEKMRGPHNIWDFKESFLDNDLQLVLDKLEAHFKGIDGQAKGSTVRRFGPNKTV